jgi:hypothetical protein
MKAIGGLKDSDAGKNIRTLPSDAYRDPWKLGKDRSSAEERDVSSRPKIRKEFKALIYSYSLF